MACLGILGVKKSANRKGKSIFLRKQSRHGKRAEADCLGRFVFSVCVFLL